MAFEDDRIELRGGGDTVLVGHETFSNRVDGVKNNEFGDACSAYNRFILISLCAFASRALGQCTPAPTNRAAVDSCSTFLADPLPTTAGGVGIDGAIVEVIVRFRCVLITAPLKWP